MPRNMAHPSLVRNGIALSVSLLAAGWLGLSGPRANGPVTAGIRQATVRRMDLTEMVRATGVVASAVRTVIRCPVENIRKKAATTVIALAPEGSRVRAGDVICRLDTSEYEEMVQRQSVVVAEARADCRRAELELEAAQTALREYQEGRHHLESTEIEGRVAAAKSEANRLAERLQWSRRMLERGYASRAQVADETGALQRARFEADRAEGELRIYREHGYPRALKEAQSRVESTRADFLYQSARLLRHEERLTQYQRQVELSTIRAPHDGLLLYAHKPKRNVKIEEGMQVHQNQELFYLPDLSRMEVQVLLHETVLGRVRAGMRARIRLEERPGELEGTLATIEPMPLVDRRESSSGEVKNFMGRIPMDARARTLHPGASAEVVIATHQRIGAVTVPAEAPRREENRDVCYVVGPAGLEKRPVVLGLATAEWCEVIKGIEEGDVVALEPPSRP